MRWTHELTGNILWNCNVEQLQLMFLVTYNERRFYQKWKSDITCLVFMIFNGNRKKCISTFVPNSVSCMLNKHFDYWSIIDRPSALNFWIWYRIYTKAQGATSGFKYEIDIPNSISKLIKQIIHIITFFLLRPNYSKIIRTCTCL